MSNETFHHRSIDTTRKFEYNREYKWKTTSQSVSLSTGDLKYNHHGLIQEIPSSAIMNMSEAHVWQEVFTQVFLIFKFKWIAGISESVRLGCIKVSDDVSFYLTSTNDKT